MKNTQLKLGQLEPMKIFSINHGDRVRAKINLSHGINAKEEGLVLREASPTFFGSPVIIVAFGSVVLECLNYQIEKI